MNDSGVERGPRVDILFGLSYDPDVRVRKIGRALAHAGGSVRVLAWDREGRLPRHERDGPIEVTRIRLASRRGRGITQVPYFGLLALRMLPEIRARRPNVLHAVDLPMLLIAVLLTPFLPRPRPAIVYDAFEVYTVMVAHRFAAPVLRVIAAVERWLPRRASLVITPGDSRRRWFLARGVESIVVPNWPEGLAVPLDRAQARNALDIPGDRFTVGYAGAILGSRDLDALLRFARRHPEDLVLIAGSGDRMDWLRNEAHDLANVRILGWLPDPVPMLSAIDVAFYALRPDHPYAALAAPNNLYVAIAYGLPLVYRSQGELQEVGREHRIGVPFSDDQTLDAAIDALRDAGLRAAIRSEMTELAVRYRWDEAVRPMLAAYPGIATSASRETPNGP